MPDKVSSCPSSEKVWNIRNAKINCNEGKSYHCLLDVYGQPTEVCLKGRKFKEGCPWVLVTGETVLLGRPLTSCSNEKFCPDGVTTYSSNQLYKYPACFVKEEYRANYSLLGNTDVPENGKGSNSGGSTSSAATIIAVIFCVIVIAITIFALFFRKSLHRTCKSGNGQKVTRGNLIGKDQFNLVPLIKTAPTPSLHGIHAEISDETDLFDGTDKPLLEIYPNERILVGTTIAENDPVEDTSLLHTTGQGDTKRVPVTSPIKDAMIWTFHFEHEVIPFRFHKEHEIKIQEIDEDDEEEEEDKGEIKEEEEEISERRSQKEHPNTGLSLFDQCNEYVNKGLEEALKQALGRLIKKCPSNISVLDVKKIICLWVKMHDKPNILEPAIDLLSKLDNECCIENLELMPEHYTTPITLLLYACRLEKEKTVRYLLQRLKCINHTDKEEKSVLHYCVMMGSIELIEQVIEKDISLLNKCNIDERTAFNLAFKLRKLEIAEFLLERGAIAHDENYKYETVVNECLMNGWTSLLKKVLKSMQINNASVSDIGKVSRTLMFPYKAGNISACEEALALFPDMLSNSDYYLGDHPLIWAMKLKPVKDTPSPFILSKMSNDELFTMEDSYGYSALHIGIKYCSLKMILRHSENNFLLNKVDRKNNTPLMYAVKCKKKNYFSILLQQEGVNITNTDCDGKNVLHLLVENNWVDKCNEILRGEDSQGRRIHVLSDNTRSTLLKTQDIYGRTPLMYAVLDFINIEVLQLLLDEGSELLQIDREHNTVFHHLVGNYSAQNERKWIASTRALMRSAKYRNYLLKVKDSRGQSLSDIASQKGCLDLLTRIEEEELVEKRFKANIFSL